MVEQLSNITDPYTIKNSEYQSHIEQTQLFTRLLINVLKDKVSDIDDNFIAHIDIAAIMHDVGKKFVPDSIIFKKGKLTASEYDIVKTHTTQGYLYFLETSHNLDTPQNRMIQDVILYHHERWDGSGYPQQKKGTEIPLAARIVALADVFEALISPRSYKPPYDFEKAKNIICDNSGTHFDPLVVWAFLKQEDKFRALTESLQAIINEECCN